MELNENPLGGLTQGGMESWKIKIGAGAASSADKVIGTDSKDPGFSVQKKGEERAYGQPGNCVLGKTCALTLNMDILL